MKLMLLTLGLIPFVASCLWCLQHTYFFFLQFPIWVRVRVTTFKV